MNYSRLNKEAWEEAYENRNAGWEAEDIYKRCLNEMAPFFQDEVIKELSLVDFKLKTVGQFCCNNGRELLSLMKFGAKEGIGFDIAENMINTANEASKLLKYNCTFIATDILKIDKQYENYFDFIIITIGALTWFENLEIFFEKVSFCLKDGGTILINDSHPFTGLIGAPGEEDFDPLNPDRIMYSYFKDDPWIESNGMKYLTNKEYSSKTFYSFSHTLSSIINALCINKLYTTKFLEFDYDISENYEVLDHYDLPLSYLLTAVKKNNF